MKAIQPQELPQISSVESVRGSQLVAVESPDPVIFSNGLTGKIVAVARTEAGEIPVAAVIKEPSVQEIEYPFVDFKSVADTITVKGLLGQACVYERQNPAIYQGGKRGDDWHALHYPEDRKLRTLSRLEAEATTTVLGQLGLLKQVKKPGLLRKIISKLS